MVTITTNTKGTIYAGSVLEMSCTIILGGQVVENKQILVVNSRWTGPDGTLTNGTRITLTPAVDTSSNGEYTSTVTIDTLRKSDSGTYSCMVTVSQSESEFITDGMNTSSANVNVQGDLFIVYWCSAILLSRSLRPTVSIPYNSCFNRSQNKCIPNVQHHSSSQCASLQHLLPHLHCHCTRRCGLTKDLHVVEKECNNQLYLYQSGFRSSLCCE